MGGASGDGGCSAKVQIGAELLCKGAKVEPDYRVRSTEYGGQRAKGDRRPGCWQARPYPMQGGKGGPETGMLAGERSRL